MSVRLSACIITSPTGRLSIKFETRDFYKKNGRESPVRYTYTAYFVVKDFYASFCANPTNSLATDTKSQTDSCGFNKEARSYFVKKAQ
jgi:hypothetical protein